MNFLNALEPLLTIHEAVAWVQFRTIEAVAAARTVDGLAAFRIFEAAPLKSSHLELRRALRAGKIIAQGQTGDGQWRSIPPRDWFGLPVAPTTLERQRPYCLVIVNRDELMRLFPGEKIETRRGAPPKYDWNWIETAAKEEDPALGQSKLAEVLITRYREKNGQTIGLSTMKKRLSAWGFQ